MQYFSAGTNTSAEVVVMPKSGVHTHVYV